MPPPQALAIAKQKGLDLVEISPTAVPPVCRIMDFGKYQYQEQKRAREARKHQKVIEVKEIKFRPKVDEHDYQFKKKHIERFLEDGDKVKATIFFRGREMAHPEIGRRILERLIGELSEVGREEETAEIAKTAEKYAEKKVGSAISAVSAVKQQEHDGEKSEEDQTEDPPRRGEALQADQERQVPPGQRVQPAHPDQQDQEA